MTQLIFTPLEDEYQRVYCPICCIGLVTKMPIIETLLCPVCNSKGKEQVVLLTIKGGKDGDIS